MNMSAEVVQGSNRNRRTSIAALKDTNIGTLDERILAAKENVQVLVAAKMKAKKEVKNWAAAFEARTGRAPSTEDKQTVKHLFATYKSVRTALSE